MRTSLREFLCGAPRRPFVIAAGLAALAVGLVWLASTPLLASTVRGSVLVDGQPVEGAFYYPMPASGPQGNTGPDGQYEIEMPLLSLLEYGMTVEVCVVLPDGSRTEFGEQMVSLWPGARRSLDIELGGRKPWRDPR